MVAKVMMEMGKAVQNTGCYVVLFRNGQKDAAKIIGCNIDNEELTFELISGTDKGKVLTANYDPLQEVNVYNEESVILAILET